MSMDGHPPEPLMQTAAQTEQAARIQRMRELVEEVDQDWAELNAKAENLAAKVDRMEDLIGRISTAVIAGDLVAIQVLLSEGSQHGTAGTT